MSELTRDNMRGRYFQTADGRVCRVVKVNATHAELEWQHSNPQSLAIKGADVPRRTYINLDRLLSGKARYEVMP